MKRFACIAAVVAAATVPVSLRADESHACGFEVKARCASGDARVTLANGAVKRLEVNVFWCGPAGQPGYTCTIDSARGNKDAVWSNDGGATVITNAAPWTTALPDRIKVTVGQDVAIDFKETQSVGRCGAGAALPETLIIPAQKGACRVKLPVP